MVAEDAGAMQIQLWEGAGWRCTGAMPRSMTHHTGRPKIGEGEQMPPRVSLRRPEERICGVTGQRDTKQDEARGGFALQRVVSCGRADLWWRTKLDFGGGEPFDDPHWSSTLGTPIKIRSTSSGGRGFLLRRLL